MPEGSYTTKLFNRGVNKIAQKVGEEAVETVIEAVAQNREAMIYEASDLVYHLLVLLDRRSREGAGPPSLLTPNRSGNPDRRAQRRSVLKKHTAAFFSPPFDIFSSFPTVISTKKVTFVKQTPKKVKA